MRGACSKALVDCAAQAVRTPHRPGGTRSCRVWLPAVACSTYPWACLPRQACPRRGRRALPPRRDPPSPPLAACAPRPGLPCCLLRRGPGSEGEASPQVAQHGTAGTACNCTRGCVHCTMTAGRPCMPHPVPSRNLAGRHPGPAGWRLPHLAHPGQRDTRRRRSGATGRHSGWEWARLRGQEKPERRFPGKLVNGEGVE